MVIGGYHWLCMIIKCYKWLLNFILDWFYFGYGWLLTVILGYRLLSLVMYMATDGYSMLSMVMDCYRLLRIVIDCFAWLLNVIYGY